MLKRILAAAAVAAGLLLAAPAAADADVYTSGAPCVDVSTIQAGGTATVTCVPGTWAPSELITWTGSGFDGANIHMASSVTFSKHANADGSDILHVTLPSTANGVYTITGVGTESGHVCSVSVTVLPADTTASTISGSGSGLADTGSVIAAWSLWVGGGLLIVGVVAVAVAAWMRKVRSS